jgi:hypothetical protein
VDEILNSMIERRFVRRQRFVKAARIAIEHARDLRQAQAERPQRDDLRGAREVVGAVDAMTRRRPCRRDEAVLLIEPQRLDRYAEPRGCR